MGDPAERGVGVTEQGRFVRRSGLTGVRYRAKLQPAEAQLLREVVSVVQDMLARRLEPGEQDELAKLTGMATGSAEPPDYAPLARLVPDFFAPPGSEDAPLTDEEERRREQENAGMRMLHEPQIVESKLTAAEILLRSVPARGGTVSLTEEQALAWIQALNDVRLVLGEVLMRHANPPQPEDFGANGAPRPGRYRGGVPEERPDPQDPMFASWQAYYWSSMMQNDLVEAMM